MFLENQKKRYNDRVRVGVGEMILDMPHGFVYLTDSYRIEYDQFIPSSDLSFSEIVDGSAWTETFLSDGRQNKAIEVCFTYNDAHYLIRAQHTHDDSIHVGTFFARKKRGEKNYIEASSIFISDQEKDLLSACCMEVLQLISEHPFYRLSLVTGILKFWYPKALRTLISNYERMKTDGRLENLFA